MDSTAQNKKESLSKSAIAGLLNISRVSFLSWMKGTILIEEKRIPLHQHILGIPYEDYRRIRIFSPKQVKKLKGHFGI